MNEENQNPNNSSTIQVLLDLLKTSTKNKDMNLGLIEKTSELLELLQKQKYQKVVNDTDDIFNSHKYNESKMYFAKLNNFDKQQIIANLSPNATKILVFFICVMSQQNKVSINSNSEDILEIIGCSRKTLDKGLKELESAKCIVPYRQDKKNAIGTIYMLNPLIATATKDLHIQTLVKEFSDIQSADSSAFSTINKIKYTIVKGKYVDKTNKTIQYNYVTKIQETETKKDEFESEASPTDNKPI